VNRGRDAVANILIVVALALAAWWLLRGAVGFVVGVFWFLVAVAVVAGILYLAAKVRGGGGGNT
jgi:hypothetical protein